MNKKVLLSSLLATTAIAVVGVMVAANSPASPFRLSADSPQAEWHHYSKRNPTSSAKGIREYWVQCAGSYQFTEPQDVTIVDKGSDYDLSEFAADDPRYFSYQYDEDNLGFDYYDYGCKMYSVTSSEYKDYRATYEAGACKFNLYSEGSDFWLWKIELPRIDYTRYPSVTMKVTAPNWYEQNMMGPEADQLTYHTNFGGNKTEGKITLSLRSTGLHMEFNSLEYASQLAFENTFTDSDIISGLKSAYFYTQDKWDRYINISDVILSTTAAPETVYSYAGDTSKVDVENGTVSTPDKVDFTIINNNYATSTTGLVISGNANPGAAVITLPAVNFNQYTATGSVSFKFGVKNNGEHMYVGSGDSKVDLGTNRPTSESENCNGYVNWEMVISAGSASVRNVYSGVSYPVTLSAGMRAGTERIVISGGATSMYRVYLVTDFVWNA